MEETMVNETMENTEIENFDNFDAEEIDAEYADENHGDALKFGLIGVAAAAAVGGLVIVGKKVVAPKLGTAKEKFEDWREDRKLAKAEKAEAKKAAKLARKEYIKIEKPVDPEKTEEKEG